MTPEHDTHDLPRRLVADWPAEAWRGVHVLAAASGGADSMALVRALLTAKCEAGGAGQVFVAHVNHQLRGRNSDDDEAWLCQQCAQLGAPFMVRRADAAALADEQGDGLEAAARALRYGLLTEMAEEAGARFVVTAHTNDDQVETVLFRLLRGSGLRGLAGMRRSRPLAASVTLMRPLLGSTREELRAHLEQLGQPWREDPTNQDVGFARNRIRGELLPYLRKHFNAEVDAAVARTAELVGDAQQVIDAMAGGLLQGCRIDASAGGVSLHVDALAERPTLLVVEVLRQAWRLAGWPEQAMTRQWWRQLARLAQAEDSGARLNLPGNVHARREGDLLVLSLERVSDPDQARRRRRD